MLYQFDDIFLLQERATEKRRLEAEREKRMNEEKEKMKKIKVCGISLICSGIKLCNTAC